MSQDSSSGAESGPGASSSRRRFVKAVGVAGAVGLAGCQDGAGPGAGNGTDGTGGDGGDGGGGGTVEMAMPSNVTDRAEDTRQALYDAGLSEDIDVSFLSTSEISGDVQAQYRSWLNAGRETPDVFRMDSGWTIPFIVRDQLVNLSERLSQEAQSMLDEHYFEAPLESARAPAQAVGGSGGDTDTGTGMGGGPRGELYGVPWQVGFPTIQYRSDLVTDAGFDPEGNNWGTEPMTWQRFSEVISETHGNADVEYGFNWQGTDYVGLSCCTFNEFMSTWGGAYFGGRDTLFGPVGERPVTVNEEPVHQALRMVRTLIHGSDDEQALDGYQQISPNAVLEWTEGPSLSPFTNGNAVALRYWPSGIFEAATAFEESDNLSPDDLGTMPIPYAVPEAESEYEGIGGTASALGGWHLTVNPNSQNVDAAVQVIEATMQQSFRTFQFSELGYLTGDRRLFDPENVGDVDPWGPHLETLRVAGENAIPRPVTVVWPDQSSQIASRVNAVIAQQQAPEDAMSALAGSLEEIEQSV
ncbi:extracellular solute-binding protein [Halosimplex pelagicum]|uniref:Extracellular solute-binding protein n=1 Tax=Halosimplex pelagicum TaxID=869886 RepID=A0A7D5T757_9EURY|nr:extracellular solute-binding protein [Halosimplex pelagicum]QLH84591.1 extracellular solute-binding protein [Halosimplex pelagicum]